jgi:hypothetical protein
MGNGGDDGDREWERGQGSREGLTSDQLEGTRRSDPNLGVELEQYGRHAVGSGRRYLPKAAGPLAGTILP